MNPPPDSYTGMKTLVLSVGFLAPIYLFPLIIQGEAIILRRLMPHGRATRSSLLMNSVTTVIGLCSLGTMMGISARLTERLTGADCTFTYWQLPEHLSTFAAIYLALTCTLSVLVKGGILMILERQYPARRAWSASLAANVISYTVLFVLVMWWFASK
ncbi:MAG: hypothetical protein GY832_14730 [Chloroflexi bacterium]|nr:hypothetical protein [Chloroflexota bacterium]